MPQSKLQGIAFSVLMAVAMVYGMELYNQVIMAGTLTNELLLTPLADIVPLSVAVIVLEHFLGGPGGALPRAADPGGPGSALVRR